MIDYFLNFVYFVTTSVASILVISWIWKELTMGICRCKGSMKGKVVLITGGNNGIGFETSLELARRGASLIIGCRNIQNVKSKIQRFVPNANIDVVRLDLSSIGSIQKFVEEVKSRYDLIDVLINNAGLAGNRENKKSEDGFEVVMATNYFGHALLNHLLLDLVKRAGHVGDDCSRIILVSSIAAAHKSAANELCKIRQDRSYDIKLGIGGASCHATVIYTNVVVPVEAFLKAYSKYLLLDSNFYYEVL